MLDLSKQRRSASVQCNRYTYGLVKEISTTNNGSNRNNDTAMTVPIPISLQKLQICDNFNTTNLAGKKNVHSIDRSTMIENEDTQLMIPKAYQTYTHFSNSNTKNSNIIQCIKSEEITKTICANNYVVFDERICIIKITLVLKRRVIIVLLFIEARIHHILHVSTHYTYLIVIPTSTR